MNRESPPYSITSFGTRDCINLFAVVKEASVTCWHFDGHSDYEEILEDMDRYAYRKAVYDLYLVGGNESTTQGEDSLLSKIHRATKAFFHEDSKIRCEVLNTIQSGQSLKANVQLNGALSICYH